MATRVGREQFLSESPAGRLSRIASGFAEIAAGVTRRVPDAQVTDAIETTRARCEWAATEPASVEAASLLPNLKTALETWQRVWPRLGRQREFRQAVAREAGLWSRHLEALTRQL